MINRKTELLADGFTFLEGPRWHGGELWMAEIGSNNVLALGLDGQRRNVVNVPGVPSGLGFLPDGTPLVLAMTERRLYKIVDGELELHADLSGISPMINDMVVDEQGRAYVGDVGFDIFASLEPDKTGNIVIVQPDGSVSVGAEGLVCPNGCAITGDGRLVVAESLANRISFFPIGQDGSLGARASSVDMGGLPDGICVDREDAVWVSVSDQSRFDRVLNGEVVERVEVPGGLAVACQLGGEDGRTLFCLIFDGDHSQIGKIVATRVETAKVDVPGRGSP